MDYQLTISIGALVVSVLVAFSRSLDKSLSIREHEEFSKSVHRDIDRVERRIELIEQTRPTTGELEARMGQVRYPQIAPQ
jgi:vacuolar-type H+-ATPase subunit D/Vma8